MNTSLLEQMDCYAQDSSSCAILSPLGQISYAKLIDLVTDMRSQLQAASIRHIGILYGNKPQWIVVQLAAFACGIPVTPIPPFFSREQQCHVLTQTGIDCMFTDNPQQLQQLESGFRPHPVLANALYRECPAVKMPEGTALVTFTSGTTGQPKGVCLSLEHIVSVTRDLVVAVDTQPLSHHLCLMPLAVLLENIAGVLLPLISGKTVILLPTAEMGLSGSSRIEPECFTKALNHWQPDSLIATPQLLKLIIYLLENGRLTHRPSYIAVGGGRVARSLLLAADSLGLAVYEGYGLSECASVVALNAQSERRVGSVGKPLPSCRIHIAPDGEVLVSGSRFLGYLGEGLEHNSRLPLATGDLGSVDEDGFLYIEGRKKTHWINSYGRNLSPEWVEAELCALSTILQACVVGDGEAFLSAIITPQPGLDARMVQQQIDQLNCRLPDYAQVAQWLPTVSSFSPDNGQLTANGRIKRDQIALDYRDKIEEVYATHYLSHQFGG